MMVLACGLEIDAFYDPAHGPVHSPVELCIRGGPEVDGLFLVQVVVAVCDSVLTVP